MLNMLSKGFLMVLIALQFLCAKIKAQPIAKHIPEYTFKAVGIKEGLSQSTVLSIYQDYDGFIWLGTRNGLNRYDGHVMKVFRNGIGKGASISGNKINKILEDKHHNLWIATNEGLNLFDRKQEIFIHYAMPDSEKPEILSFVADDRGFLWLAGAGGLFIFDPVSKEIIRASIRNEIFRGIDDQYISFLNIQDNRLFIGTNSNGLYIINLLKAEVKHISPSQLERYGQNSVRVNTAVKDKHNNIWIGTNGSGLYRFNTDGSVSRFSEQAIDKSLNITNDNIRTLNFDHFGRLWLGTFDGLNVINTDGDIDKIYYQDKNPKGISHGSIRSLYTDREGNVWVGTYFGGANIYSKENQIFRHFDHVSGDKNSLSYNVVGAFTESDPGRLIIGTERGGINIFDVNTGKVIANNLSQKNRLTIKSLFKAKDQSLWAGVFREGLQEVNPINGLLTSVHLGADEKYLLNKSIINAITEDTDGYLWLATDGMGGIHKFSTKTKTYESFTGDKALYRILGNTSVRHILLDKKNRLWIATRGKGLLCYYLDNGKTKTFPQLYGISKDINSVFLDKDNLWLATNGKGVIIFNPETQFKSQLHAANGLANNVVYGIAQDQKQNLWFSTLVGLSRYDVSRKKFKNFTAASGFPLVELNEGLIYKTSKSNFLVGGNNGFVLFNPLEVKEEESSGPVIITQLNILGQQGKTISFLGNSVTDDNNIILTYKQPVFSIEYTSLNYIKPENQQYEYRFLGLDPSWYPLKDKRSITFSNLPSGRYTFEVRSSADGINWITAKKAINIKIIPPPWLSWWAICLYIIAGVAIVIVIRHNDLKKRSLQHDLKIEQLEKDHWKEVHDLKLKYFTDVSHEFRTPLTLISGPVEDLVNDDNNPPEIKKKLNMIYYNSKRLLLLIDQILDINRFDANRLSLNNSSVSLQDLFQKIIDNFKSLADKRSIKLDFNPDNAKGYFLADTDKLEKIFYNILSNAFKFTPSGGTVALSYTTAVKENKTWFHFLVADTGKGFMPEDAKRIFERFYKVDTQDAGAGVGLALTASLVELMGGIIKASSKLGVGSAFEIDLPFEKTVGSEINTTSFLKSLPPEYMHKPIVEYNDIEDHINEERKIILIAEDNPEINSYLSEHLGSEKFKVVATKNGLKAWEKAQKIIPDIVITDMLMPEMDGLELCAKLKNDTLTSHIPVIMLTAKTDDHSRISGLQTGADDYLAKPFIMKELQVRIDNLLANRKRLQEKFRAGNSVETIKISINKHDQQLLDKIINIIDKHISEPNLSVEFIGDRIGMSREHLFRKLKAISGFSPSDFIRDYRLKRAATLLVEQQVKVAEAAYEVGYQDVQYFSKCFKKKFNCSPQNYYKNLDGSVE